MVQGQIVRFEGPAAAAEQVARELVQQQHQRQRAARLDPRQGQAADVGAGGQFGAHQDGLAVPAERLAAGRDVGGGDHARRLADHPARQRLGAAAEAEVHLLQGHDVGVEIGDDLEIALGRVRPDHAAAFVQVIAGDAQGSHAGLLPRGAAEFQRQFRCRNR